MAVEIERKFLVVGDDWRAQTQRSQRLVQGYLTRSEVSDGRERPLPDGARAACSVRVRIGGDRAWLNIKSAIAGIERREYEYAIPLTDAALRRRLGYAGRHWVRETRSWAAAATTYDAIYDELHLAHRGETA